jgi:valyl-tRNA synthetase
MPKAYDPQTVEQRLYDWWEAQGYFKPVADNGKKPFVISMPPPNVTGELHLGHAITATMEDLMIRWHRMLGQPTLWAPGSDHASIAVHYVVDKALASRAPFMDELLRSIGFPLPPGKQPMTRDDLGRENFLKLAWAWRTRYGGFITEQHRRLGASCDWQREAFTLDAPRSRAVREAFARLYKKGWIYKGKRLINWCPGCRSSVSDLEVEHEETKGHLWTVRYHLDGAAGEYISVATTRPETILGDTAVAVNPTDKRYQKLVGRIAILPVLGRRIPIIADEAVDPAFGTGAVKVTPGHDPTDNEIGQRHNLEAINVLNLDGTMNENAGTYAGLDRFAARKKLVQQLQDEGLLVKVEDYSHSVGHCQRSHDIIEPLISEQWFAKQTLLAQAALKAVQDGRIKIIPERFTKVYYHWMENIRDWNISRQLWWGHRIPAWYCDGCGEMTVTTEEKLAACPTCGGSAVRQDEDVLDTWFSSALWPFSTLGWPSQTDDLKRFYPTSVLETGYDIIFFWVARMIMMGLEMTGDIPFDTVYLHGMIRDEKGEKMSKTKGNVVNPIELMDKYGTDALRFALATGSTPGNDMKLSLTRVESSRNFANKLWNAARFIKQQAEGSRGSGSGDRGPLSAGAPGPRNPEPGTRNPSALPDRWILSRYNRLCRSVGELMEGYQFGEAARQIEDFLWGEFCDWYIEMSKIRLYEQPSSQGDPHPDALPTEGEGGKGTSPLPVLLHVLEGTLRLLHPFMPFVTEEIWQQLKAEWGDKSYAALIIAPYPQADASFLDDEAERQISLIMDIVRSIRNARAEFGVDPAKQIEAIIAAGREFDLLNAQTDTLATLARLDRGRLVLRAAVAEKPQQALALVSGGVEVYLPLAGMVDLAAERARLGKEIAGVRGQIENTEKLLANDGFTAKAPANIIERERQKLAANRERLGQLEERLRTVG